MNPLRHSIHSTWWFETNTKLFVGLYHPTSWLEEVSLVWDIRLVRNVGMNAGVRDVLTVKLIKTPINEAQNTTARNLKRSH